MGPPTSVLGEVRDGLRLIWSDRRLRVVVLVIAILDFGFAGPTTAGVPLLAAEQGWGPGGIGWVLGGFGVGAVATAAVLAWRRPTAHAGVVAAVGLTLMAVGVLVSAWSAASASGRRTRSRSPARAGPSPGWGPGCSARS